ncbi:hypothetical protein J6590_053058 [Homalodisca vitripennis]|nr:hypothetical protein J6590_053058 [Homalodisca vitripennis]
MFPKHVNDLELTLFYNNVEGVRVESFRPVLNTVVDKQTVRQASAELERYLTTQPTDKYNLLVSCVRGLDLNIYSQQADRAAGECRTGTISHDTTYRQVQSVSIMCPWSGPQHIFSVAERPVLNTVVDKQTVRQASAELERYLTTQPTDKYNLQADRAAGECRTGTISHDTTYRQVQSVSIMCPWSGPQHIFSVAERPVLNTVVDKQTVRQASAELERYLTTQPTDKYNLLVSCVRGLDLNIYSQQADRAAGECRTGTISHDTTYRQVQSVSIMCPWSGPQHIFSVAERPVLNTVVDKQTVRQASAELERYLTTQPTDKYNLLVSCVRGLDLNIYSQ